MKITEYPVVKYFYSFVSKGHTRTIQIKKNVLSSFIIKGLDIFIYLLLVPVSLNYLGQEKYGVWLTISSIILWLNLSDAGLGNGLRNKFTEAVALGNKKLAKEYVSNAYAILSIIVIGLIIIFVIINNFINWDRILNITSDFHTQLSRLILIVFISFALRLVLNLVSVLLVASHKPAVSDLVQFLGRLLTFILIMILIYTSSGSLLWYGILYSAAPLLCLIAASVILFHKDFKDYQPSLKEISLKISGNLFGLGLNFFIVQISAVILFMTDNIIIAQLFGPAEVTPYQIANRYFSIVMMIFMIILSPLWSAFTEADAQKDIEWIKYIINRLLKIWLFIALILLVMLLISDEVYKIWLGGKIKIDFLLSFFWALFILLQTLNLIFANYLNGIGKIHVQRIIAVITIIINIPLSIFLAKFAGLNSAGVILATNICILLYLITRGIQVRKLLTNKAEGIWNR